MIYIKQIFIILKIYFTALDSDEEPATKKAKKQGKYPELNRRSCRKSKKAPQFQLWQGKVPANFLID